MRVSIILFYTSTTFAFAQEPFLTTREVARVTPVALNNDIRKACCMQLPCVCGGYVAPEMKPHGNAGVKPSTFITTIVNTQTDTSTSTSLEVSTSYTTYTSVVTETARSTKTYILYPEVTHLKTSVESWLVWPEVSVRAPALAGHTRTRARMQIFRPKETSEPAPLPVSTTFFKAAAAPVLIEGVEATSHLSNFETDAETAGSEDIDSKGEN